MKRILEARWLLKKYFTAKELIDYPRREETYVCESKVSLPKMNADIRVISSPQTYLLLTLLRK